MPDVTDFFIEKFHKNLDLEHELSRYYSPRPYRNAVVRFRSCSIHDFEARREILIREAGLNPFLFRADMIPGCDLLSDSGTTTMTMEQWSAMLLGDEAYGSNAGYFELKEQVILTFGPSWGQDKSLFVGENENVFIFHQGRACENAFFTILSRELRKRKSDSKRKLSNELLPALKARIETKMGFHPGGHVASEPPFFIIPSNSHFDTTEGNIEDKNLIPVNLPCREHIEKREDFPFRGNMDLEELESLLEHERDRVPLVYLTVTNNTGGGQPVSLANIGKIREITKKYGVPFFLDACRFAENAWFIQQKEDGYRDRAIREIVHEMFGHADGFHISLKKDGLVNIGGAVLIKDDGDFTRAYPRFRGELTDYQIMTEGHPTYGGLAGRDLMGVIEGLRTVTRQEYLDIRIRQIERFGERLVKHGIPIVLPTGGNAVYIDMDRFFGDTARDEDLKAIAFTALLLIAGHRLCELGLYSFGRYDGSKEIPPDPRLNYVRAAVPRLLYEERDLFSTAEAIKLLYDNRERIPGVNVDYGRNLKLRHFKSRFSFK